MKECRECLQVKNVEDFPLMGSNRRRPYCKICYREKQKVWRENNSEKIREAWRRAAKKAYSYEVRRDKTLKGYNLTQDQYLEMLELQKGLCAICQRDRDLVIDHCHTTGVVRGLLCQKCNTALGGLGDNVEGLLRAIAYLER